MPYKKYKSKKRSYKKRFSKKRFSKRTKKHFRGGAFDSALTELVSKNIENRDENYSKMLQIACKNPDNCLALGEYGVGIKRFFDDFRNLNYIDTSSLKNIGNPSSNGFIIEMPFKKHNFKAFTALKCSASKESDNLFYEYYVGKFFINTYLKKLPCFVETYDLYEFNSIQNYNYIKKSVSNDIPYSFRPKLANLDIKSKLTRIDVDESNIDNLLKESCIKNKFLCILIQHFDRFHALSEAYHKNTLGTDLYNLWYQIYFSLSYLNKDGNFNYTHYDLHASNVFLYKPFDGNKCIQMTYHKINGKTYSFKSEYIVKIIDYGRNYFNNGKTNTAEIVDKMCNITECNPDCGSEVGYNIIKGQRNPSAYSYDWVNPIVPNVSHDLRAVEPWKQIFQYESKPKVHSFVYRNRWGTEQALANDKINNKYVITNIFNLRDALEDIIEPRTNINNNTYDSTWKVVATMDIYEDGRDYEFNVLPET
jgi:hypothetical protein